MKKLLYLLLLLPFIAQAQSVVISTPRSTFCSSTFVHFRSSVTGIPAPHYHWLINSSAVGVDSTGFTTNVLANNDTVTCNITNAAGDTTLAFSNKIGMTIEHMPVVSDILGVDSMVCVGTSVILSDTTSGGHWGITNSYYATDTNGIITGIHGQQYEFGESSVTDSIFYMVRNSCGADTIYKILTIVPQPRAGFYLDQNTVCVGGMLVLDEPVNGVLYSAHGYTNPYSSAIYGVAPGDDYIYCVNSNYCGSDTSGQSVRVIENTNNIALLPGHTTLCSGDTLSIPAPYRDPYNYWHNNKNIDYLDQSRGVLVAVNTGTDTIIIRGSNICGYYGVNDTLTVLPPGRIIIPDSICLNNVMNVVDSTPGGTWSIADPAITTIDKSGLLHPVSTGITVINYTTNTCTARKTIKIKTPIAAITGVTTVCVGGRLSLIDTLMGGEWASGDSLVATVDTIGHVTALAQGTGIISYNFHGCVASVNIPVNHYDLIALTNKHYNMCAGSEGMLVAGNGIDGLWSTNDTNVHIFADHKGQLKAFHQGYVTAYYTTDKGCYDSLQIIITNCDHQIAVFPNPAKNEVTIQADNFYFYALEFMNTAGQSFLRQDVKTMFTKIDIEMLPPGMYLINFFGYSDNHYSAKFQKE